MLGIIGAGVGARVGVALYLGNDVAEMPGVADQLSYHTLALRLLDGHGFSFGTGWWPATPADQPTAHWSFLYTLFLAGIYAVAGPVPLVARLIQAVAVGVLQPWLTFRIASRLFGRDTALVATILVAGYGYFVYYAGALMTESLCIVALLWSLDVALRIGARDQRAASVRPVMWMQLGLALATAVLLRQAVLFMAPVILGWAAWRSLQRVRGGDAPRLAIRPLAGVMLAAAVMAAAILPWTLRNHRAFDQFVLLNTNAGFAFFWGNHPIHGSSFIPILPSATYGSLIPAELRMLNEAELDRALLRRGLGFVAEEPGRYLVLSLSRIKEYVRFWPAERTSAFYATARAGLVGTYLALMLAGVFLVASQRRLPMTFEASRDRAGIWLLLSLAGVYSLIHLLTWTLVRYRVPVDAMLAPFGALSIVCVHRWLSSRPIAHRTGSGLGTTDHTAAARQSPGDVGTSLPSQLPHG
jgi:hypothetical protein